MMLKLLSMCLLPGDMVFIDIILAVMLTKYCLLMHSLTVAATQSSKPGIGHETSQQSYELTLDARNE